MEFSCTQENLKSALTLVGHIAARQGSLPILANVLLRAEEKALSMTTTNLEVAMRAQLRGRVESDGILTVNAKLLGDVVNLLPREKLDARVDGGELHLTTPGHQTKVRGMDAAEFPLIPEVSRDAEIRVDAAALRDALSQVVFAAAPGSARPELGGVYWCVGSQDLTITATDSFRLAERVIPIVRTTVPAGTSTIIPSRTVQEVLRVCSVLLATTTEPIEVAIALTANQLLVTIDALEITSRLIEGSYPDYQQIIPSSWTTRVVVGRADLQNAVRAASLFARTGVNDVTIRVLPNEGQLSVRSENAQLGEHQGLIDAEVSGEALTTVLNARYLLEGLAATPGDRIAFEMTGPVAPVILRSAEGDGVRYMYIIMPIKQ